MKKKSKSAGHSKSAILGTRASKRSAIKPEESINPLRSASTTAGQKQNAHRATIASKRSAKAALKSINRMRSVPSPIAGQRSTVNHGLPASKRSANNRKKSIATLRSASIPKAGHAECDTHRITASSGAIESIKPSKRLPPKIKRGQLYPDNQSLGAPQRPAMHTPKSTNAVQDAPISNGHTNPDDHDFRAIAADDRVALETHEIDVIGTPSKRGHWLAEDQSLLASLGNDYDDVEDQPIDVIPTKSKQGRSSCEILDRAASLGDDRHLRENQSATIISTIRELWKNRQAWHRAEKSLTLQGKAQCRRFTEGDKTEANKLFASLERIAEGHKNHGTQKAIAPAILPFIEARKPLEAHRKLIEKELTRLAKSLPIYPWAESVQGFGAMSLAAIVGEAGDLSNYATPSRLWKRMGLAVINGKRQRRVSDAIEALEHGYSPSRRSVMFNIGGCLVGGMGRGPRPLCGEDIHLENDLSPYQKRFIDLIRREVERVTDTWNGPEHKREPVEKNGKLYESYSAHAANRIRRRIEKEFLCDLLVAWKACLAKKRLQSNTEMQGKPLLEAAE